MLAVTRLEYWSSCQNTSGLGLSQRLMNFPAMEFWGQVEVGRDRDSVHTVRPADSRVSASASDSASDSACDSDCDSGLPCLNRHFASKLPMLLPAGLISVGLVAGAGISSPPTACLLFTAFRIGRRPIRVPRGGLLSKD